MGTASEALDGYGGRRGSWFDRRDLEAPINQWLRGDTGSCANLDYGCHRPKLTKLHDRVEESVGVARPVLVIFEGRGIELKGSIRCHPPQISHLMSLVGVGVARNLDPRYPA